MDEFANGILFFMPEFFTLIEANQAMQTVRPLMDELQEIRAKILVHQPAAWPAMQKSAGNGGNLALSKMVQEFDRLDVLVHRIHDLGAQIKDLNSGLLDFPALKDGREICLCWKHGEDDIVYWHEADEGFAGRQLIDWE